MCDASQVLARLLKSNHTLTSLDLRENKLKDDGCAVIGDALASNRGLRCLVLWSNSIGGAGIASLGEGLAVNTTLQILDMGDNRVDEAVRAGCASRRLTDSLCPPHPISRGWPTSPRRIIPL